MRRIDALLASLSSLNNDLDSSTCWECKTLLSNMDFEFIITLTVMSEILQQTGVVSAYLQRADADLSEALCQVGLLIEYFKSIRNDISFEKFYCKSLQIANEKHLGSPQLPRQGLPSKRLHSNVSTSYTFASAKDYYRVNLYFFVLDTSITELQKRFMHATINPIYSNLQYLVPKFMGNSLSEDGIRRLCQHFTGDIDTDRTVAEYKLLCIHPAVTEHLKHVNNEASMSWMNEDYDSNSDDNEELASSQVRHGTGSSSLHALANILRSASLQQAFPSVSKLLRLCMTLPVTSVAAERTFSKMRLIKSRIRSTMSDKRLCHLLLLSIESTEADCVDISKVMQHFATAYTTQPRKKLCIQ
jgi:hypothetical protein